ncbi:MAG: replication-associated recombination protein A [Nitrospinota bacterium]|nr:MAG: replication-associated recombination protein A [Nitrospinota bacterium]
MRPQNLEEFVGQQHLVGKGKLLWEVLSRDTLPSMLFWGPPGTGKTTLARIIAQKTQAHFVSLSAVLVGVKEVREVIAEAMRQRQTAHRRTILFLDEIHRFNKAQQDALLPHVEAGRITLIGATTENPSFSIIPALLSRCLVFPFHALTEEEIYSLLLRALHDRERGLGQWQVEAAPQVLRQMASLANGDVRFALNLLELAVLGTVPDAQGRRLLTVERLEEAIEQKKLLYDRSGEEHYNLISAFHKSMRGSDPDAALYWLGRMLAAGEDPLYIARRMIRFASEDVGNADPQALPMAVAAMQAFQFLGQPEGELALAQAAVYLATAPKSNALYQAYNLVQQDIQEQPALPVPLHLRNAPTRLMRELGYGKGYQYAHDFPGQFVEQAYLPPNLEGRQYYVPKRVGYEATIVERLQRWWKKRRYP